MLTFTLATILAATTAGQLDAVAADVVLKNATLVDGSGQPSRQGDLAIKGDRIVAIGQFKIAGTPRVLDCAGLVVAPGFIDLHTHSDTAMTRKETAANLNYLTQGLTTAVTGNCGSGPADVAAYFRTMEKQGIGSNVIHQVPHNNVRLKVMGNANRAPTEKELRLMEELVDQGMRDGAWGLSTGLIYNPGTYSKTDELITLAAVAAKHDGFYASHIRDEGTGIFVALDEVLAIARKAGLRVHVSHIKVSGRAAWGKAAEVIALIRRARKEGIEITADQYPYPASSTSLAAMVIPPRYREGSAKEMIDRLDDPVLGPKMKAEISAKIGGRDGGKSLRIASYSPRADWQGKDLDAISQMEKKPVLDIVLEIQKNGGAGVVSFGMNEEDVRLFMKQDFVATASDGSAQVPSATVPHPRSYGTFSRKIGRYAIEDKLISLEQAVRSASGLPADILKLPQRGYLKAGYFADVVVFDPKAFRDVATYDKPHQYSPGVRFLFVNGGVAIEDGKFTGKLAGRVLRHESKVAKVQADIKPLRALFVGNSYTYVNDLPRMIADLAKAGGARPLDYARETPGGWSLEKHWQDEKALKRIRAGNWNVVVLQDHSLGPLKDVKGMFAYARKFDAEIKKQGAGTLLYLTWARQNTPEKQADLTKAYLDLGKELNARVVPVGIAWERALKSNPTLKLHQPDMSHPTKTGTYLAACVFYATLYGKNPEGLPGKIGDLTDDVAAKLQGVAWETVKGLSPTVREESK